ncbi:MAG: helix-turn-helix transcriptional regulator [Clostridia bacterium]|nr:helix-turn-helix transcriptional regulator [Clostridia bacterium]
MANYELSNRIYELRTQKGLSQKELGAILGVSNKAVSKWETGTAIPKTETLIKLAEVFEISAEELLGFACKDENIKDRIAYKTSKTPKEINKYFLKVSVVFNVILTISAFLPMVAVAIIEFFAFSFDTLYITLILGMLIMTFAHIKLGKYLTEKSGLVGDFNKYRFLYYVVPNSAVAFISAISTTFLQLEENHTVSYLTGKGLSTLASFIATVLSIIVMVVLMNISIEQSLEKRRKTLKTIAIIVTISSLLGYILKGCTGYLDFGFFITDFGDFLFVCIDIAIVWLLCSIKEINTKTEKVAFIILPIVSMWGPIILKIFAKILRYI